jgi:glycosyltransferase involved in cell wall biosynthesis
MRILMPVTYVAESGGLHDHVEEIALSAPSFGAEVTVIGREGLFLDRLKSLGVSVISMDFADKESGIHKLRALGPWDLIHAHPFGAREFGLAAGEALGIPQIVTIHGWYEDAVRGWHAKASAIVCVTEAIATRIRSIPGIDPSKVVTIENRFKVKHGAVHPFRPAEAPFNISIASRIDADFTPVLTLLSEFASACIAHRDARWKFSIAGTGDSVGSLVRKMGGEWSNIHAPQITLLGWLDAKELSALYDTSFLTIAPGRAALDAMRRGVPSILTRQIGTFSLPPFGDALSLLAGTPETASLSGREIYLKCRRLAEEPDEWEKLSHQTRRVVELYFNAEASARRLHSIYEAVSMSRTWGNL